MWVKPTLGAFGPQNCPLGVSWLKSVDETGGRRKTKRHATTQHQTLDWTEFEDENWPQVLQKNIGVFSLRSQLAQEGNSSEEDSTWWTIDHLVCYTFGSKSNPLCFTKTKDDLIFELIFTRKRSSESVGGTVWPSLSEVTFLNRNVSKVNSLKK